MSQRHDLETLVHKLFCEDLLLQATLSNVRKDAVGLQTKVVIQAVEIKGKRHYCFSHHFAQNVQTENPLPEKAYETCLSLLQTQFRSALLRTANQQYQILISKKGAITILKQKLLADAQKINTALHNRSKKYILSEEIPLPFLVELGVMHSGGKIVAQKYDKFRQINRFLEIVRDILPSLPQDTPLHIIDFGCGKSYLTFAVHHYLTHICKRQVFIVGIDRKKELIAQCNMLAEKLECHGLSFQEGCVEEYHTKNAIDLVIALHACDTATDVALAKAVQWQAKAILCVPCCQHELAKQIQSPALEPLLHHGILREHFAALATDAVRGQILTLLGYKSQIMEFIDSEHTAKNLLLRATRQSHIPVDYIMKQAKNYLAFKELLRVEPYLENALKGELTSILTAT